MTVVTGCAFIWGLIQPQTQCVGDEVINRYARIEVQSLLIDVGLTDGVVSGAVCCRPVCQHRDALN